MRFNRNHVAAGLMALVAMVSGGCRGQLSEKPPIHPVQDMDFQDKVKAQMESDFEGFEDGRGMRTPPTGTVARGSMEWSALDSYSNADGSLRANPLPASEEVVLRGQRQFNIYCSVCHDRTGGGRGVVLQRAQMRSPGSFAAVVPHLAKEERLVSSPDGHFFKVITEGVNTMQPYGHMLTPEDRWSIVHYIRVLQSRFQ